MAGDHVAAPRMSQALRVALQNRPELAANITDARAIVAFRLTPTLSVESEVGYRRDTTGRLSATASLLYDLPRIGRFMPYLAAGAGLEEYATASRLPDGALTAQPRKAFAINAGGGLKVPVDDNWGIRTDARWFNGLGRDAGEHWRLYNGVTFPTGRR